MDVTEKERWAAMEVRLMRRLDRLEAVLDHTFGSPSPSPTSSTTASTPSPPTEAPSRSLVSTAMLAAADVSTTTPTSTLAVSISTTTPIATDTSISIPITVSDFPKVTHARCSMSVPNVNEDEGLAAAVPLSATGAFEVVSKPADSLPAWSLKQHTTCAVHASTHVRCSTPSLSTDAGGIHVPAVSLLADNIIGDTSRQLAVASLCTNVTPELKKLVYTASRSGSVKWMSRLHVGYRPLHWPVRLLHAIAVRKRDDVLTNVGGFSLFLEIDMEFAIQAAEDASEQIVAMGEIKKVEIQVESQDGKQWEPFPVSLQLATMLSASTMEIKQCSVQDCVMGNWHTLQLGSDQDNHCIDDQRWSAFDGKIDGILQLISGTIPPRGRSAFSLWKYGMHCASPLFKKLPPWMRSAFSPWNAEMDMSFAWDSTDQNFLLKPWQRGGFSPEVQVDYIIRSAHWSLMLDGKHMAQFFRWPPKGLSELYVPWDPGVWLKKCWDQFLCRFTGNNSVDIGQDMAGSLIFSRGSTLILDPWYSEAAGLQLQLSETKDYAARLWVLGIEITDTTDTKHSLVSLVLALQMFSIKSHNTSAFSGCAVWHVRVCIPCLPTSNKQSTQGMSERRPANNCKPAGGIVMECNQFLTATAWGQAVFWGGGNVTPEQCHEISRISHGPSSPFAQVLAQEQAQSEDYKEEQRTGERHRTETSESSSSSGFPLRSLFFCYSCCSSPNPCCPSLNSL